MDKQKAVIFVCADETQFGGERDYMKALAAEIKAQGPRENTTYFFCKHNTGGGDAKGVPLSDADYAAIASADSLPLQDIARMAAINIVAVGNSTLRDATSLADMIADKASSPPVAISYITHMISDSTDLKLIADREITVFTPSSRTDIAALDPKLAKEIKLIALEAVPHTNSAASSKIDYDAYMNTSSGQAVARIINEGEPFAFVVLNAGFSIDGRHVPYTAKEAQEQGAALGNTLPAGTHLILAHGGPRNLLDEQAGHNTMDAFTAAYQSAQAKRHAHPEIISERYTAGLPYNIIKVGYLLSHAPNFLAFISNSEGYGTMDGAALHVDNRKKLLGMFPFQALYKDATGQRKANIEKYNRKGIAVLRVEDGKMIIEKHPQQIATPSASEDPANHILRSLGLAGSASAPVKGRPKLQA